MNNIIMFVVVFFVFSSCGMDVLPPEPLGNKMLKVVEISPAKGGNLNIDDKVIIKFSQRLNTISVGEDAILIVEKDKLPEDVAKISVSKRPEVVSGVYSIADDGVTVEYKPDNGFKKSGEYSIVITSNLSSEEGIAFYNSGSGGGVFVSNFFTDSESGSGQIVTEIDGSTEGSTSVPSNGSDGESSDEISDVSKPAYLVINEVYYDVSGSDTEGDLFFELYGEPGGCIGGYRIVFVNGDDGVSYKMISIGSGKVIGEDGFFVIADTDSKGVTKIAGADMLDNFDPQNGPDTVQLIDSDGKLVDVVAYGNVSVSVSQNGLAMYETAPAVDAPMGASISRVAEGEDSGDNSADFVVNKLPSPRSLEVQIE